MNVELKHKWRVERNAWYIRLYLFAWAFHSFTDGERVGVEDCDINFCKLFWGYLLMPVAFVVLKPVMHVLDLGVLLVRAVVDHRVKRRVVATAGGPSVPLHVADEDEEDQPRRRNFMARFLDGVGDLFTRFSLRVQSGWLRVRKPVSYLALGLALVLGLAAAGILIYFVVVNFDVFLRGLLYATVAVVGGYLILLAISGLQRVGFWPWLGAAIRRGARRTGKGTKRTTLGFFGAMKVAYVAVKTNTCPEIQLVDDEVRS